MVPMIFSTDSGMSMMKDMAYIIIGGLVASTALAMFDACLLSADPA